MTKSQRIRYEIRYKKKRKNKNKTIKNDKKVKRTRKNRKKKSKKIRKIKSRFLRQYVKTVSKQAVFFIFKAKSDI